MTQKLYVFGFNEKGLKKLNENILLDADFELDLIGMKCPLPVLKARRQINQMAPRAVLKVTADDPAAPLDFEHFCDTSGHALLSSREQAGIFTFHIRKSPD